MQNRVFYKKNGHAYKNKKTSSVSIYKNSSDDMVNLCNRVLKKILNRRRKTEKDTMNCSISGKSTTLFVDYPVVDGIMVYIRNRPKPELKRGIDYEVVSVKRTKYYVFLISLDSLKYLMRKTVEEIDNDIVIGRLYSKRAFCKMIGKNKNIKLGEFLIHSKSLYHNGTRISNFISKYYKLKHSVDEWDSVVEEDVVEVPTKSWWQWW